MTVPARDRTVTANDRVDDRANHNSSTARRVTVQGTDGAYHGVAGLRQSHHLAQSILQPSSHFPDILLHLVPIRCPEPRHATSRPLGQRGSECTEAERGPAKVRRMRTGSASSSLTAEADGPLLRFQARISNLRAAAAPWLCEPQPKDASSDSRAAEKRSA